MNRTIYNPVIRDTTTFIRTAAETGYQYTEAEVTLMPGGGTPMHYHETFEETFIVSSGTLTLQLGRRSTLWLKPGEYHSVPAGKTHRFFNATQNPVTFKVLIAPGNTGFEHALRILYGLAEDGYTDSKGLPKKLAHTAVIMTISDMNAPGILSFLMPFFKLYSRSKRGKSVRRYLLNRYCRQLKGIPEQKVTAALTV